MTVSAELAAYLHRGVAKAGSQRKLASSIGVTEGRISKLLTKPDVDPLSELNCLRLAIFLDEPDPRPILMAAGKETFATLLGTYMQSGGPTPEDRTLLRDFHAIDEPERTQWRTLLHTRGKSGRRRTR